MSKFTTRSTSFNSAAVEQDLIIEETATTRRIFRAVINDVKLTAGETVSGTIIHQRKGQDENWTDYEPINLATLKAGEGVRLKFHSETLKKFYEILKELYTLGQEGVRMGVREFLVGEIESFIEVPSNRKQFVQKLLEQNFGEEIWKELTDTNPDLVTRLSRARIQHERSEALEEFEHSLIDEEKNEAYWQQFFYQNQWIFGYGLNYQFLSLLMDQANYGGSDYTGKGSQNGDFLMSSNAMAKFTCLVEIKKPITNLLTYTAENKPKQYRNGVYLLSRELTGAVSQLQVNCNSWQETSRNRKNDRGLHANNINTVMPKGVLIIGNTKELDTDDATETFELYRRNMFNPEIITFDELHERAKFIVHRDIINNDDSELSLDDLEF